jgi:arylsulfatase A-like enzyme
MGRVKKTAICILFSSVLTGLGFEVICGASKPNIVLLFVDDLGWADLEYKTYRYQIPNVQRLMADGITFTDAYAASPTCSPSRASLITGQHPARLKLVRHIPPSEGEWHTLDSDPVKLPSRNWLPLEVTTIAEALKPQGYVSAFVGKWHLGPDMRFFPVNQGFDEQYGVTERGSPRSYYPPYFGADHEVYKGVSGEKYLTDKLTDEAVSFIERQTVRSPFLLTLFYYSMHTPYKGRKDFVSEFRKKGLTGNQLQHAAMFAAVDESVGRIREVLKTKGVNQNTVIFFLGDQGGLFANNPLRGGKQAGVALYEGGARIPFSVHWPAVTEPGSVINLPVLTLDVFPTIVDMTGGNAGRFQNLDGLSLVPLLQNQAVELDRDEIYLYRSYDDQYAAVRKGDWKLIAYRSGRDELYNLRDDLSENKNLIEQESELARELRLKLGLWEDRMGIRLKQHGNESAE